MLAGGGEEREGGIQEARISKEEEIQKAAMDGGREVGAENQSRTQ